MGVRGDALAIATDTCPFIPGHQVGALVCRPQERIHDLWRRMEGQFIFDRATAE